MLDTGATANFIHQDLVREHGIQTIGRQSPLTTKDIHGRTLAIINEQAVFRLQIRSHIETITMDIMSTGRHSIVLGMPWMETHDPWVRMAERELTFTSRYCQDNCLENDPHVEMRRPPEPDEDTELFNVNRFEIDDEGETSDTDREAELFGVDGTTYTDP